MIKTIPPHKGSLKNMPVDLLHTRCDLCQLPYRQSKIKFYQVGVSCWCADCLKKLYEEIGGLPR